MNKEKKFYQPILFIQGDEERRLGVKVSPFMNRSNPQVAELQRMFINNLIVPIVKSFSKAGVLAGECPQDVLIGKCSTVTSYAVPIA